MGRVLFDWIGPMKCHSSAPGAAGADPAAAMADRVLATVLAFGGEQSRDDIAVLVVRPTDT